MIRTQISVAVLQFKLPPVDRMQQSAPVHLLRRSLRIGTGTDLLSFSEDNTNKQDNVKNYKVHSYRSDPLLRATTLIRKISENDLLRYISTHS